jgi:hypothetical protein
MRKVTTSIPAPSSLSVAAVARRWAIWRDSPLFPMQQVDDRRCRDEQDELGLWVLGCQVPRPLDQLGAGRGLVGDHEVAAHHTPHAWEVGWPSMDGSPDDCQPARATVIEVSP